MGRFFGCVCLGLAAAMAAHEAGVPWWRDWQIGDAADIGMSVCMGLFWLTRPFAQAIDARSGQTACGLAPKGESAVGNADAPISSREPSHTDHPHDPTTR